MKIKNLVTLGLVATVMASSIVRAADTASSDEQAQFGQKVHDYLVNNPEVLVEASQRLQQKQQQNVQEQAKTAILDNVDALLNGKLAVAGNPKGNVTLVEFFDYQCIHCKKMAPVVEDLIKKDSNLRVVYKEFPIFGDSSELASKVALAAAMQGKYMAMQNALLKLDQRLDETLVMSTAKSVGLNMTQLEKDMKSKEVTDALDANRQLAEKIHLMGTPAFVIAATPDGKFSKKVDPTFIPGAASLEALQEIVKKAAVS